jgi:hypothetical protein
MFKMNVVCTSARTVRNKLATMIAKYHTLPRERIIGQREQWAKAISGEFNLQDAANTLWAYH